ncbi:MAG: peptidoglycan DD-metalloendopeptidase family protein, partial [Methylocella sp.]
ILIPGTRRSQARVELARAPASANFSHGGSIHAVQSGDTLFSLGRRYKLHPYAIADLNGLSHNSPLHLGQKIRIPAGGRKLASAPAITADESAIDAGRSEGFEEGEVGNFGAGSGKSQQRLDEEPPAANEGNSEEESSFLEEPAPAHDAAQSFRWPVKGRVISAFGAKPGGMRTEGINIAVPEGAGVRAADSGVVAYAGNELKGYGNLVLIRHHGGWVTAYAHNKELIVKRGDTVKRGDMIARAGRTGSVESPQLHFELRKGATAVDPIKYLASATVAN